MDAVCLNLRRFGCTGQFDSLHDVFNAPRYAGGCIIANLLIDFLFQWSFIFHHAIHGEQSALKAAHGVLAQKVICKQRFDDFPVVAHPVSGGCTMLHLRFPCIVRLLFQGRSLPFRSIVVAFHLDFPAKEYPADIAHGLHSACLRQNRDVGFPLDFVAHKLYANLPTGNDSCTRFCRIALSDLAVFPPACREVVENYLLQKVQNLQPTFQPLVAGTVETVLR